MFRDHAKPEDCLPKPRGAQFSSPDGGRADGFAVLRSEANRPAANFCAGTKPRFHIGAHRNTPTSYG